MTDASGARFDVGEVSIDSTDRTHMSVALRPDIGPGVYVAAWTSLSATDGDPADGAIRFTVDPTASPGVASPAGTSTARAGDGQTPETGVSTPPSASSAADGAAFPTWALVAGLVIVVSGTLAAVAVMYTGSGRAK